MEKKISAEVLYGLMFNKIEGKKLTFTRADELLEFELAEGCEKTLEDLILYLGTRVRVIIVNGKVKDVVSD